MTPFIRVAVPVPTLDLLTYRVPTGLPPPPVGARVIVPVGARAVTGVVVAHTDAMPGRMADVAIKPFVRALDERPFVPARVVELAQWTAEYYAAGAGATITAVLPPKARGDRADGHKVRRVAALTPEGNLALRAGTAISPRQRDALQMITEQAEGVPIAELADRGISADRVARLAKAGWIHVRTETVERDPFQASGFVGPPLDDARRLTAEQRTALDRLTAWAAAAAFRVALLHGVTGSGKTEVYLRLAASVRRSGRQVLLLVPEIALTPATSALFHRAFGGEVAVQHSGLSEGERHDQWQRIRRGSVGVVIGTRSAVFAPLERVGLIVVDEEHDGSYKQEETPRYNARDVAIVRGQRADALVVLGSATPSLETYHRAMQGKYDRVTLTRRIHDRPLASVTVVDMREEYASAGPDVILSRALRDALTDRLERREQAVVLLNRRGYSTAVFCRQCAGTVDCPNCSVSLVVHGVSPGTRRAQCHYCSYSVRVPQLCQACGGSFLEQTGFGTERVEAEIGRLLPVARVARVDRDTIRRRGALDALLTRFRRQELDVLVGTQMIAKGHDFPSVTLVGVISADVGLGMADFRAAERTFQLLTQVSGRAGRGETPGEAIVQTLYPDHYSIQLACHQDYVGFYDRELRFRQAMRYPPTVSLINTIVRAKTFSGAMQDAAELVARLRAASAGGSEFRVLGPAPAPLGRLRGEYRVQFLVKGKHRRHMREALMAVVASLPEVSRRTTVDVDPLSVL